MIDIKTLACGPKHLVLHAIAEHRSHFMGEFPRAIFLPSDSMDELVDELLAEFDLFQAFEKIDGIQYCGTQFRVGDADGYPFMLCANGSAVAI